MVEDRWTLPKFDPRSAAIWACEWIPGYCRQQGALSSIQGSLQGQALSYWTRVEIAPILGDDKPYHNKITIGHGAPHKSRPILHHQVLLSKGLARPEKFAVRRWRTHAQYHAVRPLAGVARAFGQDGDTRCLSCGEFASRLEIFSGSNIQMKQPKGEW